MAKPSDFYVGVHDLFSALLPGAVTLGGAIYLDVPDRLPGRVVASITNDTVMVGSFVVVAYVVGQVSNSIGSMVLDTIYDRLYQPKGGWLSWPEKPEVSAWERLLGLWERGASERQDHLLASLRAMPGMGEVRGGYHTVRSYLRLRSPASFDDVEKLEADQKFYRSLTVGMAALAASGGGATPALVGLALLLFVRYLGVRRKTVERAYRYFSLRSQFGVDAPRREQPPPAPADD